MKIIKEPFHGTLLVDGDLCTLRQDSAGSENLLFLTYAFITHGPEHHILPSVLLDDWGKEIGGLELYRWIEENGQMFPRAEVFGIDPSGGKTQYFLRDLELTAKYPLYAFSGKDVATDSAVFVRAVLLPDDKIDEPQRVAPPGDIAWPLRRAAVEWWRVNPRQSALDFFRYSM